MGRKPNKCENCAFLEEFDVMGFCRFEGKSLVAPENRACKKFLHKKNAEPCPCDSAPHHYCNNAEGCPCADYNEWVENMAKIGRTFDE